MWIENKQSGLPLLQCDRSFSWAGKLPRDTPHGLHKKVQTAAHSCLCKQCPFISIPLAALALVLNAFFWGVSRIPLRQILAHGLHPVWTIFLVYTVITVTMPLLLRKNLGQIETLQIKELPALSSKRFQIHLYIKSLCDK